MDNAKEHTAPRGVKLTAVTVYNGPWNRRTAFIPLPHDSRGRAIIGPNLLSEVHKQLFHSRKTP